jgi:two-component system sensor histidine kinase HydH
MSAAAFLDNAERERLNSRYAEIAALAGGLAHEIKNPLSTMSLNLELLVEDLAGSDTPRDKRMLRKIQSVQRECRELESILEDFLKFARVGALELVESDLNQAVQEFIDFYQPEAAAQNVEISPHLSVDLPAVRLDRALFRQVLMNLALNAQQAMPKGGLLELQTSARGGRVILDLIDNGCGMDEQTQSHIFDVFFSTKSGGSGLGLPTVKKIVEAHGGQITVESEPTRGTRFTISLPAAELS